MTWPDDFIISRRPGHSGNGTVIMKCRECLSPHMIYASRLLQNRGQYCSKACAIVALRKKMIGSIINEDAGTSAFCKYCGRIFWYYKSVRPNAEACSLECKNKLHGLKFSGANHPLWRGGRFPNWRGNKWQTLRQKIRQTQDYRCVDCGKSEAENGKQLDVHHIEPYRIYLRTVESELVGLCRSCHIKRERCL